ncbi:hypothetical protein CesoFtcFv8_022680 [Champsocephalus esox]|uniref:Uncharacterized protein n=1 Tax=Champsocephalus esox TaxID=159716 RepID=A0AAN8GFM3_9TELE|nr:hypothetical protein CesoFtcFv8_022680 [Champsocephalus esox]
MPREAQWPLEGAQSHDKLLSPAASGHRDTRAAGPWCLQAQDTSEEPRGNDVQPLLLDSPLVTFKQFTGHMIL